MFCVLIMQINSHYEIQETKADNWFFYVLLKLYLYITIRTTKCPSTFNIYFSPVVTLKIEKLNTREGLQVTLSSSTTFFSCDSFCTMCLL